MVFETFTTANTVLLWSAFGIAFVMGAVVNKTNWCTMGAVSDLVNIGDTGRWRSWLFAIIVAITGVIIIEKLGLISLDTNPSKPLYRASDFKWFEYILGGLLFGIGMTFGSGCGNKILIRTGGGNIKSFFVLLVMGFFAYWMIIGFDAKTLYGAIFYPWTSKTWVAMSSNQDLGSIFQRVLEGKINISAVDLRLYIGGGIAALTLIYVIKSRHFFSKFDNILGGLVVGLAVVGMWYVTGAAKVNAFDAFDEKKEIVTIADYVKKTNWDEKYQTDDRTEKSDPKAIRPDNPQIVVGPQAMTFVSPSAWLWNLGLGSVQKKDTPMSALFNIPVMLLFGIIVGSFFWALVSRSFRIEWFASFKDFFTHIIAGVLMGVGGVLAVGCTIGQGITGISTLAIGSFLAFISIVIGSTVTMKIQLYKMVYEEAGFGTVFVTALADVRLLPKNFKKLESI